MSSLENILKQLYLQFFKESKLTQRRFVDDGYVVAGEIPERDRSILV